MWLCVGGERQRERDKETGRQTVIQRILRNNHGDRIGDTLIPALGITERRIKRTKLSGVT